MAGKDYKHILSALKEQGWELEGTSNSHIKAYPPDKSKPLVCFAVTSSDHRALKNTISDLRASGFRWPALRDVTPCDPDLTMPKTYDPLDQFPMSQPGEEPEEEPMSTIGAGSAIEEPEQPEQSVQEVTRSPEQLFLELKEARTYAALAKDALQDSLSAFEEAQEALKGSEEEYERAVEQMNLCKRRFDKAFSSEGL